MGRCDDDDDLFRAHAPLRGCGSYVPLWHHAPCAIDRCKTILDNGGVVEIYPEARIPDPEEAKPLPFKPSTVYLALESGAPIIPVYTNGCYFKWKRARMIIGTPFDAREYYDDALSEKENIENITNLLRERIIDLGKQLDEKIHEKHN